MKEYNDDQKYENYVRIRKHINMMEKMPLTEDKLVEYKEYFYCIREFYPDFRNVHPDITEIVFRSATLELETYAQILDQEFNVKVYLQFMYSLRQVTELLFVEDELAMLMDCMGF